MKKNLNILCIADHVDPLIYSSAIKERFGSVDAVISCGDLKHNYYEFIVSSLNAPFLYVLGNHSSFTLKTDSVESSYNSFGNLFQGGILADGKIIYIKELDLLAAGLGGSKRYNRGDNQYTETEMFFRILRMIPGLIWNKVRHGRFLDLFITHAPPRNVGDREDPCHRGFRVFRWFIRKFKPFCMIHGHIHLYSYDTKRISTYDGVPVINVYNHYLLQLPGENP